jgi:hypothetical protein
VDWDATSANHFGLVQSGHHYHLIENQFSSCHDIAEKLFREHSLESIKLSVLFRKRGMLIILLIKVSL